jgi:hypothetical protein
VIVTRGLTGQQHAVVAATEAAGAEKILWSSNPDKAHTVRYRLHQAYWMNVLVATCASGAMLALLQLTGLDGVFAKGLSGAADSDAPNYALMGLLIFIIGSLWGGSFPWREGARAPRTLFALTETRLLHVTPIWFGPLTTSCLTSDIADLSLVDHLDGLATIVVTLTEMDGESSSPKRIVMIGIGKAQTAMRQLQAMRSEAARVQLWRAGLKAGS